MMNFSRYLPIHIILLILYWSVVLHVAVFAPLDLATFLFSEKGTFEIFSPFLWFFLALICLFSDFKKLTRFATSAMALLLGFREMDLHKSLFSMSFLKTNFYRSHEIPISDKILGALICLVLLVLTIYLAKTFLKDLRQSSRSWLPSYRYTFLAFALMVASKFGDRLNAQLNELFHIEMSERLAIIVQSWEESTEMIVPLLLCIAVRLYQLQQLKSHHL